MQNIHSDQWHCQGFTSGTKFVAGTAEPGLRREAPHEQQMESFHGLLT